MAVFTDTSGATITTLIPSYYRRVWLDRLEANLVYDKFGEKTDIPKGEGSSVIWHALKNIGAGYTLDETTAAGTSAVSTRKVSAVLSWKAQLVQVTTRVVDTSVNPIVKEMVASMGYSAAVTKDALIADSIGLASAASTGVVNAASVALPSAYSHAFPLIDGNTATTYWSQTALSNGKFSSTPTIAHVRNAVTVLRTLNALPFEDGFYKGVIHPEMSKYIRADSTFATWNAYANPENMEKGLLGFVEGVKFFESSTAMTVTVTTSNWSGYVSGGTLYGTLIFGKGAYGVTNLSGNTASVSILNQADKSDPHNLAVLIGYKFAAAAKVLNPSAGIILTTLIP